MMIRVPPQNCMTFVKPMFFYLSAQINRKMCEGTRVHSIREEIILRMPYLSQVFFNNALHIKSLSKFLTRFWTSVQTPKFTYF